MPSNISTVSRQKNAPPSSRRVLTITNWLIPFKLLHAIPTTRQSIKETLLLRTVVPRGNPLSALSGAGLSSVQLCKVIIRAEQSLGIALLKNTSFVHNNYPVTLHYAFQSMSNLHIRPKHHPSPPLCLQHSNCCCYQDAGTFSQKSTPVSYCQAEWTQIVVCISTLVMCLTWLAM